MHRRNAEPEARAAKKLRVSGHRAGDKVRARIAGRGGVMWGSETSADSDPAFLFIQVVGAIPEGRVVTYGQVARLAGYPGYARQVGATLSKLPRDTRLPWYRVLNARGRISLPPGSDGYHRQKDMLESEGVVMRGDKVSLALFGWKV